jgi:hypothetical protein
MRAFHRLCFLVLVAGFGLLRVIAVATSPTAAPMPPAVPSPLDTLFDPNVPQRGLWKRFGLPNMFGNVDWRKLPSLSARVLAWEGGNRFKLDNGQVWEGSEPITYELVGAEIEIQARPFGQFALIVNGKDTKLRVIRLR